MKRFFLILTGLLLLYSCETLRIQHTLNNVETYLQDFPDSAWHVLDGLDGRTLASRHLQAHHALLYSLAADKSFRDYTEDSVARVALAYYEHHGSRRHRMLAWYSLARVQMNAQEDQRAAISLNRAKEEAERLHDHHYLGLIYSNLSLLFNRVYDHAEALNMKRQSIHHFQTAGDSLYILYGRTEMASCLNNVKHYEKALALLDSMKTETEQIPTLNAWIGLQRARILSLEEPMQAERAKEAYLSALRSGIGVLSMDFGNLAYIYAETGDLDSADYYLNCSRQTILSETDSVKWLYDRYRLENAIHAYEPALRDYRGVMDYQDSLLYVRMSQTILHALNDDQQSHLASQKLKAANQRLVFLIVLLLCLIGLLYLLMKSRAQRARLKTTLEQVAEMKDKVAVLKAGRAPLLGILQEQYLEKIRDLKSLSTSYFYWDRKSFTQKKKMGELRTEGEILDKFREQLAELRNDAGLLTNLENALNMTDDRLIERIREAYRQYGNRNNNLDEDDYKILVLMLAGFGSQQISLISGVDYDVVRKRKSRYIRKFEKLPSPDAIRIAREVKKYM